MFTVTPSKLTIPTNAVAVIGELKIIRNKKLPVKLSGIVRKTINGLTKLLNWIYMMI